MHNYKTNLFLIALLENSVKLSTWSIVATSVDFKRMQIQYSVTSGDRLLLHWDIMAGTKIIRANLGSTQFCEDFNNIDMPFNSLSNQHRAGLYVPILQCITEFLREE